MKKITTILLVLLMQSGFCNSIDNNFFKSNDNDLAEKLSKDTDFIDLWKNSVSLSITLHLESENLKSGKIVPAEEKVIKEDLINKITVNQEKVLVKFPSLNNLSVEGKKEVYSNALNILATGLTFAEFSICLKDTIYADIKDCFVDGTIVKRMSFVLCMAIFFGGDVCLLAATEFAAGGAVALGVPSEVTWCANIAFGIAAGSCTANVLNNFRICLKTQRED